jgi:NRPS condensation-like uncharacterized protein
LKLKDINMVNFGRKLGLVEHLFATLHSMGAMLYVNIASIQGAISCDVLRAAIDLVQKRHPLLQVHLQASDDGFSFEADGILAIPLRVIDRLHQQQWLEIAEDELVTKFSDNGEPLCRLTLLKTAEVEGINELIVTFHHAIADGISALHFIHELLSYYQQLVENTPISPIDSLPLLPPFEQLLAQHLSTLDAADLTQIALSQANPAAALIIEQTAPVKDRSTRLIARKLDRILTSQIKDRCRDEQTTVHGALCAATILACARQLLAPVPVLISCSSSVNLRGSCFPSIDSSHLGCFVSNVTISHHVQIDTNFWELARECKSNIDQLIYHKVPHDRVSNPELRDKYQPSFIAQLAEHNMGRSTTTHVSNLGQFNFPTAYGSIQLESFYFAAGLSLIGTCLWLGAVTVNQKICCTFTYTHPLISTKTAAVLVNSTIEILDRATA